MEDRREWIAARAAEISADLRYPSPPLIEFEKPEFSNTIDSPGIDAATKLPCLRIDPEKLETLSERELIYRLTLALIQNAPGRVDYPAIVGILIFLTYPTLTLAAILYLATRFTWFWLFALPTVALANPVVIPFPFPIVPLVADAQSLRDHLKTIDRTGDAITALEILRSNVLRQSKSGDDRLTQRVRREAEKRGYQTLPSTDS